MSDSGPKVRALLERAVESDASDLLLVAGKPVQLRVNGVLVDIGGEKLTPKDTQALAYAMLTEKQKVAFEQTDELDFSFNLFDVARFRGSLYRQRDSIALVLRRVPYRLPTLEELGTPPIVADLADRTSGFVLVTGPTGSGKTTTLAAMVGRINTTREAHIVTIEDPIEFLHRHDKAIVSQREVESDTKSFADALKSVLRQSPDVLMIGELRDRESAAAALTIAETGHLTLASLHTGSAPDAIHRIVDFFPPHQQVQVRTQLSMTLEAVVVQKLLPRANGSGRVLACEVLTVTPAVRTAIRDDRVHQLHALIQAGSGVGMRTMNQSLLDLFERQLISAETAEAASPDAEELLRLAKQGPPRTDGISGVALRSPPGQP